jgi:PAS domain S-box-containing protein
MKGTASHSKFSELRRRAEELLKERAGEASPFSEAEIMSLIHELEVHQIELDIQNEELRHAHRRLEKTREEYFDLYELAPIAYVTLDKEGIVVRANVMAAKMLGRSEQHLVNRGFSQFIHPGDHSAYFTMIREIADGKTGQSQAEIRLPKGKKSAFYARFVATPTLSAANKFAGWRIAFMDISEQKQAQDELRTHAEKLERTNSELQEFAFIASHDLQEPLRKVATFSDMVIKRTQGAIDETSLDYLKRVKGAVTRMQDLLRALLKYSRIATQASPPAECDLGQAVREAASDLDLLIQRTGAKIEISDLPPILADAAQIRQVFQNLIANALKFHKEGSPPIVKIYALPGGTGACSIAVEDNGIGFAEESAAKIFAPFQRLHGRSSPYHGTGMGLAICRKIVERHGGSITAKSTPGEGSTFIVNLPLKPGERQTGLQDS